jgi:hypothetical protein
MISELRKEVDFSIHPIYFVPCPLHLLQRTNCTRKLRLDTRKLTPLIATADMQLFVLKGVVEARTKKATLSRPIPPVRMHLAGDVLAGASSINGAPTNH